MPAAKLKAFLDLNRVPYQTIRHPLAFTAPETAQSAHVKGKEMAKTVVVKLDGRLALAVLPANRKVDLEHLRRGAGATSAELARERDFRGEFPECELGAMPPFGNLYGMEVYVEPHLAEDAEIAFNAGSHTELVRMPYGEFERLVHPHCVEM